MKIVRKQSPHISPLSLDLFSLEAFLRLSSFREAPALHLDRSHCTMSPKLSLLGLIAIFLVATALAATAHSANQNGEDVFGKVKSLFIEDGKINTLNTGVATLVVLILTVLVCCIVFALFDSSPFSSLVRV